MKLIIKSSQLEFEFERLINHYQHFYSATAWAGVGSKHFNNLLANKHKIEIMAVGIHFYQTHPDFIRTFLNHKNVQFVNQPQGTFHPKVYLFHNSDDNWEVIIGSSNFTKEAFSRNTEANMLINSSDVDSLAILRNVLNLIKSSWGISQRFTATDLKHYQDLWKKQRIKIKSLSGLYGSDDGPVNPPHDVSVINMTWKEFVKQVKSETSHHIDRRLNVLKIANDLFKSRTHFYQLEAEERQFIAGVTTKFNPDWGYFGSMIGRGDFVREIKLNNHRISEALDQIPLTEQIAKIHYDDFVKYFKPIFSGNYIGVASRLLAMKRPDVFYCLTSKNKQKFCKDFSVKRSEIDYERYWAHVIERIYDSEWWSNPNPSTEQEKQISNARAAFLDAIYYEE